MRAADARMARAIYLLMLLGLVTFGLSVIFAIYLAWWKADHPPVPPILRRIFRLFRLDPDRPRAPAWVESHYRYQKRTCVAAIAFAFDELIALLLIWLPPVFWVLEATALCLLMWFFVRTLIGYMMVLKPEPVPDPMALFLP